MDDRVLRRFCANENGRYAMTAPFYRGGYRYATDGRVSVRIAVAGAKDDAIADPAPPPAETLPWAKYAGGEFRPWPAADYVFERKWDECECGEEYLTWAVSHDAQRVGNRLIGTQYHYLISTLPGVEFSPTGDAGDPLYFRFVGGEGMVMPMRKSLEIDMPEAVCGVGA